MLQYFIQVTLLDQTFVHCPIFLTAGPNLGPGPCLSSSVVVHPLRPTKDRRLGFLLKNQQPNLMQLYLLAKLLKSLKNININIVLLFCIKTKNMFYL